MTANLSHWAIKQARVRSAPVDGATVVWVPAGKTVMLTGQERVEWTPGDDGVWRDALWVELQYSNGLGRTYSGWAYAGFFEPVSSPLPANPLSEVVPILDELRTPNPFDAIQYIVIDGEDKYNPCGEFCLTYLAGEPFHRFIQRAEGNAIWEAVGKGKIGTGVSALDSMGKDLYGFETISFYDGLKDPIVGTLVSPGTMKKRIDDGWLLIAGVKIDGASGKLISSGRIGHWVVLRAAQPYGINDGQVEIYNPFHNIHEKYTYADFIESMGAFDGPLTGIWVKAPSSYAYAEQGFVVSGETAECDCSEYLASVQAYIDDTRDFIAEHLAKLDELEKMVS